MREIKISDHIWFVGENDRRKHLFENNWPLPNGVSYNTYVINDEKTALIDTIEYDVASGYIAKIRRVLNGKSLDYMVINHLEPDHASMIDVVFAAFPGVKVVGNMQTFKILQHYYNIPEENKLVVKDGEELQLGETTLQFFTAPWVHWPETMVTYDKSTKTLFSCDAFGGFGTLDGGIFDTSANFEEHYLTEMRRYYSNIVAKYSGMVQKALAKLGGLDIVRICPSHGLIWNNPAKVIGLYDKWSRQEADKGVVIAYASMYGNTEQMADHIGNLLGEKGIEVLTFDVSKTHVSFILNEIWKYKAVVLGTCAYNTRMHPMMEHLCNEIKLNEPKNKMWSLFGSSTWNGAGVKDLKKFADEAGFEICGPIVEMMGGASHEKIEAQAEELVAAIVEKLQ